MVERAMYHKEPLFAVFVDLSKAYDSISRERLWTVLIDDLNLDVDLVRALKLMYCNLRADIVNTSK